MLTLASMINYFDGRALSVALPLISRDLAFGLTGLAKSLTGLLLLHVILGVGEAINIYRPAVRRPAEGSRKYEKRDGHRPRARL
jgi:hypothetical protein